MPRGIKYATEEERKAAIADYRKRYNKSEQGKAKTRRYFQSDFSVFKIFFITLSFQVKVAESDLL